MAVADLNAAGGLLGRPVELKVFDIEELLPETVAASKDYLIDKEKVDVVVEGYGGYGPDFEAYGANSDVPFIHGSGSVRAAEMVKTDPAKYGNMFQVFSIEADYGKRAWEGIIQFEDKYTYPNKKIAILHGDLEWDLNYTAAVAAEAEKAGWQVVMNETFPYGTTDWGSILTKIRAEQPAAIVCSVLSVADISSFVKQFMENPTPFAARHLLHGGVPGDPGSGRQRPDRRHGLRDELRHRRAPSTTPGRPASKRCSTWTCR